jgi:hypothetical protein
MSIVVFDQDEGILGSDTDALSVLAGGFIDTKQSTDVESPPPPPPLPPPPPSPPLTPRPPSPPPLLLLLLFLLSCPSFSV